MIHWNADACRRAGLTEHDLITLSASSDSGYSSEVVQRFLDNLLQTATPRAVPTTTPRVVYVGTEVAAIVRRNPRWFGPPQDAS